MHEFYHLFKPSFTEIQTSVYLANFFILLQYAF